MAELIKGQLELQKQVQELKSLLQGNQACAQGAAANILFDIAGAPTEGDPAAPVTMIEFSDFQCPFSARYTNETFPRLDQEYVRTGKVRYVFRDFPLENLHAYAHKLAEAGQWAAEQKQFWKLRARFFANQSALTSEDAVLDQVKPLGLDAMQLQKCLRDGRHHEQVNQEHATASADGVSGTPTFFIGASDSTTNKIKVVKVIVGQQAYEIFQQTLDTVLAGVKPKI